MTITRKCFFKSLSHLYSCDLRPTLKDWEVECIHVQQNEQEIEFVCMESHDYSPTSPKTSQDCLYPQPLLLIGLLPETCMWVYMRQCVWYGNDDHNRSPSKTHQQSQPSSEEAEQVLCVSNLPVLLNHRLRRIFKHFHSCMRKPHIIQKALYVFITVNIHMWDKILMCVLFYIFHL